MSAKIEHSNEAQNSGAKIVGVPAAADTSNQNQNKASPAPAGAPKARQKQDKPQKPDSPPPAPIRPTVGVARVKRRHRGLVLSFFGLVLMPLAGLALYLWVIAADQYSSSAGFTVRTEDSGGASELLGGLAQFTGSTTSQDGDILYEFIRSLAMVRAAENEVGMRAHYSNRWSQDPLFALWPNASDEDLEWYWRRVVRVSYDSRSGLFDVRVLAFEAAVAQQIARTIVARSQNMINALNTQAREDSMRYAHKDLAEALARLKTAREALMEFRTRTQILDPSADIQGRMGVMNNLQQQLAEALIAHDLLAETTQPNDPRIDQEQRRIEVIRERIVKERQSFAAPANGEDGLGGQDYPRLMAEFESLIVDREFAEETYRLSLAALDLARAKAERQSRYLVTYVPPSIAQTSQYPQRLAIVGLFGLFILLSWGILVLVYYSLRDRG